jgi:hypothetical protein
MNDEQPPVDLWVMDVEDDDAFARVKAAVADVFGEQFEWGYGTRDPSRKGVVRGVTQDRAELAASILRHLGAGMVIDEEAYTDPMAWPNPSIPEEENLQDALDLVKSYLTAQGSRRDGLLTIGLYVSQGMVYRGMSSWSELPEYPMPAWDVWDEIV